MDSTNAPEELWFLACSHVCSVLNLIAMKKNNEQSAVEACLGETPNISAFTQFQFLQPILYLTHPSFPDSKKRLAHWISPAENCGDALTYIIHDAETGELLKRSVMHPIDNDHPKFRSMRAVLANQNHNSPTIPSEVGEVGVESPSESVTSSGMPMLLNPLDVIGKQFVIEDSIVVMT